jgi:hypothetical protein
LSERAIDDSGERRADFRGEGGVAVIGSLPVREARLPARALREPAVLSQAGGFGRSSFATAYSIAER